MIESRTVFPKRNAAGSQWYYNTPYHISRRGWWLSLFIRHAAPRHRPTQQQRQVDDGNNNNKELYRRHLPTHKSQHLKQEKKGAPCLSIHTYPKYSLDSRIPMYYMANYTTCCVSKRCKRTGNAISSLSPQKSVRETYQTANAPQ